MINIRVNPKVQTYPPELNTIKTLSSGAETYLPWMNWRSGHNIVYCPQTKSFSVLHIHCEVTVEPSESQWARNETWKYKSHEVLENPKPILPPLSVELIYDSWVKATGDINALKFIVDSISADSLQIELLKKLSWASLWQCLLNSKVTSSEDIYPFVQELFLYQSTLKPENYSLGFWGDSKNPAAICLESDLAEHLKSAMPFLVWKALESIYKTKDLPKSAHKFWRLYLPLPHDKFIEQLKFLDKSFLKAVYQNWRTGSDTETDMDQYSWRLLEPFI